MKKTIVVAGYSKRSYIGKIRDYFPGEEITLACTYYRAPNSDKKQEYLTEFDISYDLHNPGDVSDLEANQTIFCITCTQERDMSAYIKTLAVCKGITPEQADQYKAVINKNTFKESLGENNPELVPAHHLVTEELLKNLDTLVFPQVIKPTGLAGSTMVKIVYSPSEFIAHYQEFSEKMQLVANEHYGKTIDIITEDYIAGPQYSINTYINNVGETTFCPIIRVVTPQEVGANDTYSAIQYITEELPEETTLALKDAIRTIVRHFDLKNTSAHFDAVLDKNGWKFFEVGLRIGGSRQELYEYSHKMDHFKNDILNRLGKNITIPKQCNFASIVQKASTEVGVLQEISYKRIITADRSPLIKEGKLRKISSNVKPVSLGGGTITRHFVVGKDEESVTKTSYTLFRDITFKVSAE